MQQPTTTDGVGIEDSNHSTLAAANVDYDVDFGQHKCAENGSLLVPVFVEAINQTFSLAGDVSVLITNYIYI